MRSVVAAVLSVALVLSVVSTAGAAAGDGSYDAEANATPTPTGVLIDLRAWSDGATVTVGANPLAECTFVTGLTGAAAIDYGGGRGILVGITDPAMETSEALHTFASCPEPVFDGFRWAVWEETDPPPTAVIDALALAARSAIQVPDLTPRSAPDGLVTPFLTQLPVWLWIDQAGWIPVSGTAAIPELSLSVTAIATPITTEWKVGTAGRATAVNCAAGIPFTEGLSDDDSDCTITFTETTGPGATADLSVTTTYDLTFACTPGLCDPAAIGLPDLAITVTRPITVTEARGVIVR